jgi:hypothetical protein
MASSQSTISEPGHTMTTCDNDNVIDKIVVQDADSRKLMPVPDNNHNFATILLNIITEYSQGQIDAKFKQYLATNDLIRNNPELLQQLMAAWDKKSFKEIR